MIQPYNSAQEHISRRVLITHILFQTHAILCFNVFDIPVYQIFLYNYCKQNSTRSWNNSQHCTAWKMSVFGVILVLIFSSLDWIQRDTWYLSVFSSNVEKCRPECNAVLTWRGLRYFALQYKQKYCQWRY